ncbi:hypothetical protein tinsulaeT_38550 [Thalassotalea insulae]|uniref:Uncharacterized protein n=1 Tax=Thalassotalea insulae TaxID=2056778 RepID=A0ABQ6H186_9GAMM|nr:hypothetical protein [Thalassotalea insulae]GLX80515.1 hypothetical protein tinsulaeT_38550 [Thalassotalea insulae]
MKLLNKTVLALGFSVVGAVSSMSALAVAAGTESIVHEIKVKASDSEQVQVFVNADGDTRNFQFSHDVLQDEGKLAEALKELPQELGEKLTLLLTNFDNSNLDFDFDIGNDGDHVVMVKLHGEPGSNIEQKVMKTFKHTKGEHKVVRMNHHDKLSADSVIRLLKHGKFSAEDLDKIQQALDAKR